MLAPISDPLQNQIYSSALPHDNRVATGEESPHVIRYIDY